MSLIHKPHDKFFKETLSDIQTAKDFLQNYLPQEILALIDMDAITPQKDSYIEKELEETFSDLLFQTKFNQKDGYLYFLFEHKSYPAKKISVQLLKYVIQIWEQKTKEQKTDKLPVVIPLVVYHGQNAWNSSLKLSGMIEDYERLPEAIQKYIPEYEYILYNISAYTGEEIKGTVKLRIFLKILRDIFVQDHAQFLETLKEAMAAFDKLEKQEKGIDYFETFIRYIMNARNDLELKTISEITKEISLERSEAIMTIAEKLIAEGMEKGMKKGIEKGIEKGKLEVAGNMLALGIEMEKIIQATGLTEGEIKNLLN